MSDALMALLPPTWRPYAKTIYPAIAAIVATLILGLTEGRIDGPQLEVGLVGLVGAILALVATNVPEGIGRYMKAIAPAVMTCVVVVVHYLVTNEFDNDAWRLAIAGLGTALVVLIIPNAPTPAGDGVPH